MRGREGEKDEEDENVAIFLVRKAGSWCFLPPWTQKREIFALTKTWANWDHHKKRKPT